MVDAKLAYSFADRTDVSGVSERQPIETSLNSGFRPKIFQIPEPSVEPIGLAKLKHG
jgi:hypothetical protein